MEGAWGELSLTLQSIVHPTGGRTIKLLLAFISHVMEFLLGDEHLRITLHLQKRPCASTKLPPPSAARHPLRQNIWNGLKDLRFPPGSSNQDLLMQKNLHGYTVAEISREQTTQRGDLTFALWF